MDVMANLAAHQLPRYVRVWTSEDLQLLRRVAGFKTIEAVRLLKELAEQGCALAVIARRLRRTVKAIRNRAQMHGISLRAAAEAR
jgi:hypothetical protein